MKCNMCGADFEGVKCPYCGDNVNSPNISININNIQNTSMQSQNNFVQPPQNTIAPGMKNKWTAFILCLLFGVLGVHKFYEGKIGMGVLYLFTGGLFCIGVIIDLIVLLTKPTYYKP